MSQVIFKPLVPNTLGRCSQTCWVLVRKAHDYAKAIIKLSMCQQQGPESHDGTQGKDRPAINQDEPFPWHLPLYDAHCHPTDTMSTISSMPKMRTRALTIMATRSQDQDLVSSVTKEHGLTDPGLLQQQGETCKVIPAFGWHPWFSHQLFDDTSSEFTYNNDDLFAAKKAHYQRVLQPAPEDRAFIDSLPTPKPISEYLKETEAYLLRHPFAMVGEIGLDKAFRLPRQWDPEHASQRDEGLTPGGREGRHLSPHRVKMEHQRRVLLKQLSLAGKMGRAVSVHGVQAHGVLHSTLSETWKGHKKEHLSRRQRKRIGYIADDDGHSSDSDSNAPEPAAAKPADPKPYPPRICLHSFSGAPEVMHQYLDASIPAEIYFSFSAAVNLSTDAGRSKLMDVLREVPKDRVLVESDLHRAGDEMEESMEGIVRVVCEGVGWGLEEGITVLGRNYHEFAFGG